MKFSFVTSSAFNPIHPAIPTTSWVANAVVEDCQLLNTQIRVSNLSLRKQPLKGTTTVPNKDLSVHLNLTQSNLTRPRRR